MTMCVHARVYVLMRAMCLMYACISAYTRMNMREEIGRRRGAGEREKERENKA
jgi:hypothetical protein